MMQGRVMQVRSGRGQDAGGALSRREVVALSLLAACRRVCPELESGTLEEIIPMMDAIGMQTGALVDQGLSGRLYTDLSMIGEDAMMTENDSFYVRTATPALPEGPWKILLHGLVAQAFQIGLEELLAEIPVEDLGEVLLECSGNTATAGYGLMSATRWAGVRLTEVLARVEALPEAVAVEVIGVDFAEQSKSSMPGCSWIFPLALLQDAFLVTEMNGEALPAVHGGPVRLIVPGWYGCCQTKWVRELRFVGADEPSNAQMQEFAARTHQDGTPALARDFIPATMDPAAMPIRVERWMVGKEAVYRVVGVLWGGTEEVYDLQIQINNREPEPVEVHPGSPWTWRLWTYCWENPMAGEHTIRMVIADDVETRRLDSGWYERTVKL